MMFTKRAAAALGLLAALSRVETARADDNQQVAEAIFDEGLRLLKDGKIDEACSALGHAVDLAGGTAVGGLLLLGDCQERQGRPASAWATYRKALAAAHQQSDPREVKASQAIERLEPTLPKLTVRIAPELADRPGLEIHRGGATLPREAWGVALPVDPGRIVIIAELPGASPHSIEVTIGPGPKAYATEITPWATVIASAEGAPLRRGSSPKTSGLGSVGIAGILTASAGVVALGVGIGVAASAKSKYDRALGDPANQCSGGLCNANGQNLVENARSQGNVATGVAIAGVAIFAVGATLVVVDLSRPTRDRDANAAGLSLRVGPSALEVFGRF